MAQINEKWKPVVGYPNYEVCSSGRVRHVERRIILKHHSNHAGYPMVCLYKDGVGTTTAVHRIVALAHLGSRPENFTINHKDGNKENNDVSNLEYVSMQTNREHAIRNGLWGFGERNGLAKLTENDVREIRALSGSMPRYRIAERYGVTRTTVSDILKGRTWTHVP